MIWPGRRLALALLIPSLLSLGLFVTEALWPVVVSLDVLLGAVALADLATLLGDAKLRADRRCGKTCSLDQEEDVELTLENLGRFSRRLCVRDDIPDVFSADPAEFIVSIPCASLAILNYSLIPRRRGSYQFQTVDILASSSLGFWRRSISLPCLTEVRVYPDIRQIARYSVLARRDKLNALGVRRSRKLGNDNEFERLRDYVEGDEPRHIDWRSTARRQKLTVRAHQTNQSQRIIFMIDCGRMMAGDTGNGLSPLDHALNAMLMMAYVALIRGDQVGVLAFSNTLKAYIPPGGGATRINRIVHGVHNLFPELVEPRYDRAFVELEKRCRKRSLVVLTTNIFDDVNADTVAVHLGHLVGRHLPMGVFLRDQDIFSLADNATDEGPGLYRGAAAAALLNWRERALAGLRLKGVLVLDVFADELTAPLINEYLKIKARHLL